MSDLVNLQVEGSYVLKGEFVLMKKRTYDYIIKRLKKRIRDDLLNKIINELEKKERNLKTMSRDEDVVNQLKSLNGYKNYLRRLLNEE